MWAIIKGFFASNMAAIVEKLTVMAAITAVIAAVYRSGQKAQQNEQTGKELVDARQALQQDAAIGANGDIIGMRDRLSEALRRKRDA